MNGTSELLGQLQTNVSNELKPRIELSVIVVADLFCTLYLFGLLGSRKKQSD